MPELRSIQSPTKEMFEYVYAVDFDGTLSEYHGWDDPRNGRPIPGMVNRVSGWLAAGKKVVVFSARASDEQSPEIRRAQVTMIEEWCLDVFGRKLPVTANKSYSFKEFWDDRGVSVQKNGGNAVRIDERGWVDLMDIDNTPDPYCERVPTCLSS